MGGIFFSPKMFFQTKFPKFRNLSIFTLIFQEEVKKKSSAVQKGGNWEKYLIWLCWITSFLF